MKSYPSIPRSTGQAFREFDAHVFAKLDGSNLRFEWSPKAGWSKAGTRSRLFDESDPDFCTALGLFEAGWAVPLERIARRSRWQRLTVFMEFYGARSFAGLHEPDDPKSLTLFDAAPFGKGLLPAGEFLRTFGDLPIAPISEPSAGRAGSSSGSVAASSRARPSRGSSARAPIGRAWSWPRPRPRPGSTQSWSATAPSPAPGSSRADPTGPGGLERARPDLSARP